MRLDTLVLSQSISRLRAEAPAPNDLPPSRHRLRIGVDTCNNTHLPSRLSHTHTHTWMQAAVDPRDSGSRSSEHANTNKPVSNLISQNTSSSFTKANLQRNVEIERKRSAKSCGQGRLRFDIWSQGHWNVRRVMTGMVRGRLWLTSDLWDPKGHGSLNRPQTNVLLHHEMKGAKRHTNTTLTASAWRAGLLFFFLLRFFSEKLTHHCFLKVGVSRARSSHTDPDRHTSKNTLPAFIQLLIVCV